MEFIKKYWVYGLLFLFFIMFVSKCTKSSNLKRKYDIEITRNAKTEDSLMGIISLQKSCIDSISLENKSLQKQIGIYVEQNDRLNDRNKDLSKNPVVIKVTKSE